MGCLIVVVGLLFNPVVMRTRQSAKQHHLPLTASSGATMPPLLDLGKLVRGTLVKRPSASIRSPYVADVSLQTAKKADGNLVLAHAPALDVGGMCVPGSEVYLSTWLEFKCLVTIPVSMKPRQRSIGISRESIPDQVGTLGSSIDRRFY
jgi:hypothetical protein